MTGVIFPYDTMDGALQLTISNLLIDKTAPDGNLIMRDARAIDVSAAGLKDWRTVVFEVEVAGPPAEMQKLNDEHGGLDVQLIAYCSSTNMREAVRLAHSQLDPARWSGALNLDRSNYAGKVVVRGLLTGSVQGRPSRFLGTTEDWTVYFDQPAILTIEGTLPVQWVAFDADDAPPVVREYPHESFFADLEAARPIVYLNKSFDGLPDILEDRRTRPAAEAALHDAERVSIARSVWMALFNAAAAGVVDEKDGEEADWPTTDWQKTVLKMLLPRVFPDLSDQEALRKLSEAWTADDARSIESRVQAEIGKLIGAGKLLRRAISRLNLSVGDAE